MDVIQNSIPEKPWVSFCMSTYKRPEFLDKQIECLLNQTFKNFEIVISDNDPTGSGNIAVKKFNDPRIKYKINNENLGMVKSFNASLHRSLGDYIVMITDDDPVYPDMLKTLFDLCKNNPGYGVYQAGCEILCQSPFNAKVMRSKVGLNSCLSNDLYYNEIKKYSAEEFPYIFFQGKLGALMLWSVGIVEREVALKVGGMPDYGTEYFTDHAYIVANASEKGMLYLNRSLGYQAIHGENFGFNQLKNMEKYKILPESFTQWITDKLKHRNDWPALQKEMHKFVGRSVVEFSLFIKKSLDTFKIPADDFLKAKDYVFKIPYIKKWNVKFLMLSKFPITFNYALQLKQKFLK